MGGSPYILHGPVRHENCFCPEMDVLKWQMDMQCPEREMQVEESLKSFGKFRLRDVIPEMLRKFGHSSLAHYSVIGNKVYRMTHGEIVGFKRFSDAIVLSMARKVGI